MDSNSQILEALRPILTRLSLIESGSSPQIQKHQLGLKDPHGGNILEFPRHLRIREMPRVKRETA